jgi:outer membrane receptor protein involved in Fe transport
MVRRILPLGLLALLALPLASLAAALDGLLLRADGSPAAGFQVSVVGTSTSVPTDEGGRFHFAAPPPFPFRLIASGPDGQVSAPFAIAGHAEGTALEIRIAPAFADSVTVASGVAPNTGAAPANAAILLGEEDLEQRRPQRLYEVLEGVAGASRTDETATGVPVLRGLPRGRTLVLLDDARVSTERRAGPSASFLDPFTLGSVEVVRGPGSVAYGSDALGGIVHARSRQPERGDPSLRFHVNQGTGGDDETSAGIEGQIDVPGGALLAQAYYRKADGAEAGRGEAIPDSSYEDRGGALRYAADTPFGSLRTGFAFADSLDVGKPASDSLQNRTIYPRESSRRFNASLGMGPRGAWENVDLSLFLGTYRLVLDRDRLTASPRLLERSDTRSWDGSFRTSASRALAGGRLSAGAEIVSRFGLEAETGAETFDRQGVLLTDTRTDAIEDAERTNLGLFSSYDKALGRFAVASAGLRGDWIRSRNEGGFFGDDTAENEALSGFAALTMGPFHGSTLTLQAARGFRDATLSDRYFRGPSGRGFITGNPELEPESSLQYDAALRIPAGRGSVAVYGYHYTIDDLIERYWQGNDFFFRNRGEGELRGIEIEAQMPLPAGFAVEVAAAVARGEVTDDGTPLADIAPDGGSATLRWAAEKGYAYLRGAAYRRDDRAGVAEVARPGTSTWDLGAGWWITRQIELRLLGRNLGDRRYRDSADEVASLARGRSLTLGIVGRL